MKKNNKKGFTIVELVIVIAVIAILAAVLIPTFSNVIKKAHISADTQLVRNMNTALAADQAYTNQKPEDMTKVITVLHEAGYVVGNLNPTTEGYYYIWDSEKNQIVFINDELTAHFPADADMSNKAKYWATAATAEEAMKLGNAGYSIYLEKDVEEPIKLTQWVSFDAGIMKASSVSITGSGASTIKTYGQIANLTVDNTAGSVDNYGSIGELNITGIASACFNNYGSIGNVKTVASGKLVNKAVIMNVSAGVVAANVDNTAGIIVESSATGVEVTGDEVESVIEVRTATELQNLAYAVNDGANFSKITIKLMNDIDFAGRTWTPFGKDESRPFSGKIDGNNKEIKNISSDGYVGATLTSTSSATKPDGTPYTGYAYGLIANSKGYVEIANLTISNIMISDSKVKSAGAFIGAILTKEGNSSYEVILTNCDVKNSCIEGADKVGGLIGQVYVGNAITTIKDCNVDATVTSKGYRAGGLLGFVYRCTGSIEDCSFNGTVKVLEEGKAGVGLLAGQFNEVNNSNGVKVVNFTSNGKIETNGTDNKPAGKNCGVYIKFGSYSIAGLTNVNGVYSTYEGAKNGDGSEKSEFIITSQSFYLYGVDGAGNGRAIVTYSPIP